MKIFNEEFFYHSILKHSKNNVYKELSDKTNSYTQYTIPKHNGFRNISAIKKNCILYKLQANLNNNFFSIQKLPVCVKGFVKGFSYFDFLYEHITYISPNYLLRIDIKDFFDSINNETLKKCLKEYTNEDNIIDTIIDICTLDNKLPQGAVTSPSLSNLVLRRIDQRITLYCQSIDVKYTRYADDLLFSSNELNFKEKKWFIKKIKYILKSHNLKLNYKKMKYGKDEIVLNGYVLKQDINLSRNKLYNLTSILYFFNKSKNIIGKKYRIDNQIFLKANWLDDLNLFLSNSTKSKTHFSSISELMDFLIGYRSFLISFKNYSSASKYSQYLNKVKHIEGIIEKLAQLI